MTRRDARSGDGRRYGTRKPSLWRQLLALSAGRPIFRASGHITLDGDDKVVSVHDDNDDAHVLTQSDPAKRCAAPAAHADFAGQLCLTFSGGQCYQSNRSATLWGFSVNGVSCTSVRKLTPLAGGGVKVFECTSSNTGGGGATSVGHQMVWNYPADAQGFGYLHGPSLLINATDFAADTAGTPVTLSVRLQTAATQYRIQANGTQVASGAYGGAMSATPALPFTLASNAFPALSLAAPMRWRGVFWGPVLSDSDLALVESVL